MGAQRHDLIMLHKKTNGYEGAEKDPEWTDLVHNHGNAAQAVLHDQLKGHPVFDHIIKALKKIHQQIQHDERAQAEAEYFQKFSGKIAGYNQHVLSLSGIMRGPASV
jgi:hypothetical protein